MAAKKKRSTRRRGRGSARRRKTAKRGGSLKYWVSRLLVVAGVALVGYLAYLDMTIRRQSACRREASSRLT